MITNISIKDTLLIHSKQSHNSGMHSASNNMGVDTLSAWSLAHPSFVPISELPWVGHINGGASALCNLDRLCSACEIAQTYLTLQSTVNVLLIPCSCSSNSKVPFRGGCGTCRDRVLGPLSNTRYYKSRMCLGPSQQHPSC